jgi:TonB family protein
MKNVWLIVAGALLLPGPSGLFAQEKPQGEGFVAGDEMLADGTTIQDQKKKNTPPNYTKYDVAPEVVKQVPPAYPDAATKQSLEGTVWLELWVGEDGRVVEVKVQKTDAEVFNQAAIDAAKQWLFKPASVNGKPVSVWVTVPFKFKLMIGKKEGASTKGQEKAQSPENSQFDKAPEVIKQVPPSYPEGAKKEGLEGMLLLKVWIDESGKVSNATVQQSDAKVFESSALAAVKQWTFKPAILNGKPVAVWVSIPFRFKLGDKEKKQSAPAFMKKQHNPPADDLKPDKEPETLNQVNPKYPEKAMQEGIEGTVWTKMWIDESGSVVEAKIVKTDNEVLNEAALNATRQWKFKPAVLKGKPVAVWITVPFRFALAGK